VCEFHTRDNHHTYTKLKAEGEAKLARDTSCCDAGSEPTQQDSATTNPLVGHNGAESVCPEIVAVLQTVLNAVQAIAAIISDASFLQAIAVAVLQLVLHAVNIHHFLQAIAASISDANIVFPTDSDKRTTTRFARRGLGDDWSTSIPVKLSTAFLI
jgi:hypothetical protein